MLPTLSTFFDKSEINTGRQPEMDIAKGLSAIFMILCHTYTTLSDYSSPFLVLVLDYILGSPFAAPVFMFCMGVGICYSRKNHPRDLLYRGFTLLWISLIFGLSRDVIPVILVWLLSQNPAVLDHLHLFYCVDILRFAGLFFIVFAFLKKMDVKPLTLAFIAIIFSTAGLLLQGQKTDNHAINIALRFLWRAGGDSFFPLLNWFIFPASGYLFGLLWKHCKEKALFYRTITPICGAVTILYFLSMFKYGFFFFSREDYYGVGPIDALFFILVVLFMLGIGHYLLRLPHSIIAPLLRISKNINSIYCVHWVLLYIIFLPSQYLFYWGYFPNWSIIPMGILITIASDAIATGYHRFQSSHIRRMQIK